MEEKKAKVICFKGDECKIIQTCPNLHPSDCKNLCDFEKAFNLQRARKVLQDSKCKYFSNCTAKYCCFVHPKIKQIICEDYDPDHIRICPYIHRGETKEIGEREFNIIQKKTSTSFKPTIFNKEIETNSSYKLICQEFPCLRVNKGCKYMHPSDPQFYKHYFYQKARKIIELNEKEI